MTNSDDVPNFFGYGRFGIAGELKRFINSVGLTIQIERGGPSSRWERFDADAIERIAREHVDRMQSYRKIIGERNVGHRKDWKPSHEASTWAYSLLAYCAEWREPPPPALLWLVFEALGLRESNPSKEVKKKLGLPVGIDANLPKFLEAAALDGKADAAGKTIPEKSLSKIIGVTRKTINKWRRLPNYKSRRKFVAWSQGQTVFRRRSETATPTSAQIKDRDSQLVIGRKNVRSRKV